MRDFGKRIRYVLDILTDLFFASLCKILPYGLSIMAYCSHYLVAARILFWIVTVLLPTAMLISYFIAYKTEESLDLTYFVLGCVATLIAVTGGTVLTRFCGIF